MVTRQKWPRRRGGRSEGGGQLRERGGSARLFYLPTYFLSPKQACSENEMAPARLLSVCAAVRILGLRGGERPSGPTAGPTGPNPTHTHESNLPGNRPLADKAQPCFCREGGKREERRAKNVH